MDRYQWSLFEIDQTDIESLLPFVMTRTAPATNAKQRAYCDQVSWL